MITRGAFKKLLQPGLVQSLTDVYPGKIFYLDEPPDFTTPGAEDPACFYPPAAYQPEDWPEEPLL